MRPQAMRRSLLLGALLWIACAACGGGGGSGGGGPTGVLLPNPILFVTQVPVKSDWANVTSASNNQKPDAAIAYRGGDLWLLFPDGSLKNLTEAAGYGVEGLQVGPNAIAVRGPCVHPGGNKAVFSMVRGAPGPSGGGPWLWQLYEVEGLGPADTPTITKVPNQPAYNNLDPAYTGDGRLLFTSDRPRGGEAHLFPQLDEYNSLRTVTGIWSLDPVSGDLFLMQHAPSGAFRPTIDSFGRVVFTRFDHLTRDKQVDTEVMTGEDLRPFNWSGEDPGSLQTSSKDESFPEPNTQWIDWVKANPGYSGPLYGYEPRLIGQYMNRFLPWTMNQDGTQEQTLEHVGEHELGDIGNAGAWASYTLNPSFGDDPNLVYLTSPFLPPTQNRTAVRNVLQIREDPASPGTYWAVDARFHDTHASGKLLRFHAPPGTGANAVVFEERTHPTTANPYPVRPAGHTGFYRNPLPLSDGTLVAVHADVFNKEEDLPGTVFGAYDFRLVAMEPDGAYLRAGRPLTGGIVKSLRIYRNGVEQPYSGPLWELDPVEVVAHGLAPSPPASLPGPEAQALAEEGVSLAALQGFLAANDLALIVGRDVTTRDGKDRQQPYNLRVPGTGAQTLGAGGTLYDVVHLQVLQANQVRGYEGINMYAESIGGRRVLAQPQTDGAALNPPLALAPPGSVAVAGDGSVASLVPARRAVTWQLVDPSGEAVVRERYWFTLQPGEVRVCTSCHDPSGADQSGQPAPTHVPAALKELLQHLQGQGAL